MSNCCGWQTDIHTGTDLRSTVKATYAAAARQVRTGRASCCGSHEGPTSDDSPHDDSTRAECCATALYADSETRGLPEAAVAASLGCANPTALAELRPGETVLDLGSGGGIDVLISARRVGPSGKVYGLDMTDEMLELARDSQGDTGLTNVEFLKGDIEAIPLPGGSVDVIISNCVINLSSDKDQVLREAFRVLRPGGRFAVSDIVTRGDVPEHVRNDAALWAGCIAGALDVNDYAAKLEAAGFVGVEIELLGDHQFASALIRGTKPLNAGAAENAK